MTVISATIRPSPAISAAGTEESVNRWEEPEQDYRLIQLNLSDDSALSFRLAYLYARKEQDGLVVSGDEFCVDGRELSDDEEEAIRYAARCFQAEQAALRMVARAEQCCAGLARKLEGRGYPGLGVRAVIAYLSDMDLVNDERYARLWLTFRLSKGAESPRSLTQALYRKGIPQDSIKSTLKSLMDPETEGSLVRRFLKKIHRRLVKNTSEDFNRTLRRMLRYEGFSSACIEELLEEDSSPELSFQEP